MNRGDGSLWNVVEVLAILLTAAAPAYVSYDLWSRGAAPERHVELSRLSPIDPMKDLSALGARLNLSLKVEDQTIDNLLIAQGYLRNVGKAPIVPNDYTEPLSVSVPKPWKIVAVENSTQFSWAIQLRWKRVNETTFAAEPALLNPGDLVVTRVYLTNTRSPDLRVGQAPGEPQIEWKARIVNLRSFTEPPDRLEQMARRHFGLRVQLDGWALPFTLCAGLLFEALYLHLLALAGFLRGWTTRSIGFVLGATLLSFAAAESTAMYLFGSSLTDLLGVDHGRNAPPIILHVAVLVFLYYRSRTRVRTG